MKKTNPNILAAVSILFLIVASFGFGILLDFTENPGLVVNSKGEIKGTLNKIRANYYKKKFWENQLKEIEKRQRIFESDNRYSNDELAALTEAERIIKDAQEKIYKTPEEKEVLRLERQLGKAEDKAFLRILKESNKSENSKLDQIKEIIEKQIQRYDLKM